MRLTLRVLLAYLDNILEPGDAKAVEAKIAESENVSTLVHHIREITKRMRIGAPEVLGKGLGLEKYDDPAPLNVGTGQEMTIRELVVAVAAATGFQGEIRWDPSKPNGQPRRAQ